MLSDGGGWARQFYYMVGVPTRATSAARPCSLPRLGAKGVVVKKDWEHLAQSVEHRQGFLPAVVTDEQQPAVLQGAMEAPTARFFNGHHLVDHPASPSANSVTSEAYLSVSIVRFNKSCITCIKLLILKIGLKYLTGIDGYGVENSHYQQVILPQFVT
ncbi:unnamed protein product [Toxocara canis]|uniref:Uncharacterized protein n=1 Tax=Toxocara canis TaxID=6265 RepID=A0A183UCG9_TOXCA|nr:unnamed protein product [Toxocara canis]